MKKIISALLILTMLVSMVCVSTSAAGVHINMNFESMEAFTSQFIAGQFYVDESEPGLLYGYAEAKALQTTYSDPDGWFDNTLNTWLTYDASITLAVGDDDLSEGDRYINLVYCNDNLQYQGIEEDRVQMAFTYDIQERCFRFARGWNSTAEEEQLLAPVYREINTDAEEFFTLGISVKKDEIRCFYNDELIYTYNNPDMYIAHEINSPFLFWQDGNFVQITNITVADQAYLFPYGPDPVTTTTVNNVPAPGPVDTTTAAPTPVETTTATEVVTVTDARGQTVTNEAGENVTSINIITQAPAEIQPADTNTNKPVGGSSTSTGDATFVVIAAMVATLGTALIVKKVSVK